jgi:DNA topoisomerase IB
VWICVDPLGHLQATGVDAAGRKQYLYHPRWRTHRDRWKFDSMLAFGAALPQLRRRVARDLKLPANASRLPVAELTERRVIACAVRLLDLGFFRIGSDDYAERNESYGLTTMLREHVTIGEDQVIFDFPAKSGQQRVQAITDPQALAVVAALKRRRTGEQLLAYHTTGGWTEVDAEEVNAYLKQRAGGPFSAKDFRTWNATVLAAVALAADDTRQAGHAARERQVKQSIKTVAAYLGNTPAVCRASYVDPRVIDRYQTGITIAQAIKGNGPDLANTRERAHVEAAVLALLEGPSGRD